MQAQGQAIQQKLNAQSTGNSVFEAFVADLAAYKGGNAKMTQAVRNACHEIGQSWLRSNGSASRR